TPSDKNATTTYENGIVIHRFRYFPKSWQKLAYGSGMVTNLRQTPSLWLQVPFFLVAMAYSLLRVIRKEHPDVIHAHWIVPQGLVALLGKFFFKIPILISAHGSDAFAFRNGLSRRLKRFILRNSDVWTANTRATANAIGEARSLPPP
ncbi:MAG: glycosyltransferase, partial [Candidatus Latescibacteria bacterium]|nr:glycosyltransferase [Candidatus Latescibacterota bacterium]NIO77444.1 glycosyltransferase [Candidatus Latescibacterota bacterium]